jgi:hypothetical protein
MSSARVTRASRLGLADAAHPEREGDVLRHGHMRKERVVLEHHAHVALIGGRRSTRLPSTWIAPLVGFSNPASIIRSVVLPEPDGPSRLTNSPF